MATTIEPLQERRELPRVLGPWAAFSCVVGSVIGTGIFIGPAWVATNVPYTGGIALVWIVGGLFSLAGALTLAELSAMLPQAGGPYVYLREAYGRLPAFLFGWTEFLVIRAGSVATLAAGFSMYFHKLLAAPAGMTANVWQMCVSIVAMTTVAAINVVGTRVGGGVQVVGTAIKVVALAAMIVLPFALGKADRANLSPVGPPAATAAAASPAPGVDAKSNTLFGGFMIALVAVLWAYDGWANAGSLAEDIADPGKNVPRALFWGMLMLIALYLSVTLAYHLVLPMSTIVGLKRDNPIGSEFFFTLFGEPGRTAIALIVMTSVYIALNGNAMSGPRAYFAMARDGLFPKSLCTIHPRFRTPANAIIVQTVWAVTLTVLGTLFLEIQPPESGLPGWIHAAWSKLHTKVLFDVMSTYVIFGGTIFYTAAIASVFVLRRTKPDLLRPYRTLGYPVTPALYLIASAVLLNNMYHEQRAESLAGLGIILAGLPAYYFFTRRSSAPAVASSQ